jgi:hypothetical protein
VTKIFADFNLEVEYFDENDKESGDSAVSGMQLETENIKIEDGSLVAGWQPHIDS